MGGLYVLISLIIPAVLLAYPAIVKHLVFLNSSNSIDFSRSLTNVVFLVKTRTNLTHPETFGLDRVHNFYLNVESGVSLGIW